jgi:glutaminyl-tRNA synthetase
MDNLIEMSMLEACIRDDLNQHAPRAMAVLDPIKLVIENYPVDHSETLIAPNHPNDANMGDRQLAFSSELYIEAEDFKEEANKKFKRLVLGKEVRLRNAYVVKAERVEKDTQGKITTVYCRYDPETLGKDPADGRKVKGVIHWVDARSAQAAEFRLYDRLFTQANPAGTEQFTEAVNPHSLVVQQGFVESSLIKAEQGKAMQFERTGYFCADKDSQPNSLVFNRTIGLRDTWSDTLQG